MIHKLKVDQQKASAFNEWQLNTRIHPELRRIIQNYTIYGFDLPEYKHGIFDIKINGQEICVGGHNIIAKWFYISEFYIIIRSKKYILISANSMCSFMIPEIKDIDLIDTIIKIGNRWYKFYFGYSHTGLIPGLIIHYENTISTVIPQWRDLESSYEVFKLPLTPGGRLLTTKEEFMRLCQDCIQQCDIKLIDDWQYI